MDIKVTSEKQMKELDKLAKKMGWESLRMTERGFDELVEDEPIKYIVMRLYEEDGQFEFDHPRYFTIDDLKEVEVAKKLLSRPITKIGDYVITKLKGGVKIGCTTFKDADIKEIVRQLKNPINFMESYDVEFDGVSLRINDWIGENELNLLVKEGPEILKKIKSNLSVEIKDGMVIHSDAEFEGKVVLSTIKKLGYKY